MGIIPLALSDEHRLWAAHRAGLEAKAYLVSRKKIPKWLWVVFAKTFKAVFFLLKIAGLSNRGVQNALDVRLKEITLSFNDLPVLFDGYRIVHLSDLHIDALEEIKVVIEKKLRELKYDLCVITGDYRDFLFGKHEHIYDSLQYIVSSLHPADGILATMGNHDSHDMLPYLEATGMQMLLDESVNIYRGGEKITITGVDDPYYFYSEVSEKAMRQSGGGFKILLSHAPELFRTAAENDYHLYLCGHTHGGQVCTPKGKPLYVNLKKSRQYHCGLWQYEGMMGYTSSGTGVCTMPVRFFSRGEICVFTLKKTTL